MHDAFNADLARRPQLPFTGDRDDADENEWIRATAFAVPEIAAFFAVLIGATDQSVEGTWRWLDGEQFWSGASDGSPVDGLYTNWNPGSPTIRVG